MGKISVTRHLDTITILTCQGLARQLFSYQPDIKNKPSHVDLVVRQIGSFPRLDLLETADRINKRRSGLPNTGPDWTRPRSHIRKLFILEIINLIICEVKFIVITLIINGHTNFVLSYVLSSDVKNVRYHYKLQASPAPESSGNSIILI